MHRPIGLLTATGPTHTGNHLLPYNLTTLIPPLFTVVNGMTPYFMYKKSDKI